MDEPKPTLEQVATKPEAVAPKAEAIVPKAELVATPKAEPEATPKKRNIEDVANASKLPR